jgi:hypothetical protein
VTQTQIDDRENKNFNVEKFEKNEKSFINNSQEKENINKNIPVTLLLNNQQEELSTTLKNKIYFWLIDLGILKENSIKADDLPNLCANGVLLADLVNRLEGVKNFKKKFKNFILFLESRMYQRHHTENHIKIPYSSQHK